MSVAVRGSFIVAPSLKTVKILLSDTNANNNTNNPIDSKELVLKIAPDTNVRELKVQVQQALKKRASLSDINSPAAPNSPINDITIIRRDIGSASLSDTPPRRKSSISLSFSTSSSSKSSSNSNNETASITELANATAVAAAAASAAVAAANQLCLDKLSDDSLLFDYFDPAKHELLAQCKPSTAHSSYEESLVISLDICVMTLNNNYLKSTGTGRIECSELSDNTNWTVLEPPKDSNSANSTSLSSLGSVSTPVLAPLALSPSSPSPSPSPSNVSASSCKYFRDIHNLYLTATNTGKIIAAPLCEASKWFITKGKQQFFQSIYSNFITVLPNNSLILDEKQAHSALKICFSVTQGRLLKRARSGFQQYQARYFVLSGQQLSYWRDKSQVNKQVPAGAFSTQNITHLNANSAKLGAKKFEIEFSDGKLLQLMGETQQETERWLRALQKAEKSPIRKGSAVSEGKPEKQGNNSAENAQNSSNNTPNSASTGNSSNSGLSSSVPSNLSLSLAASNDNAANFSSNSPANRPQSPYQQRLASNSLRLNTNFSPQPTSNRVSLSSISPLPVPQSPLLPSPQPILEESPNHRDLVISNPSPSNKTTETPLERAARLRKELEVAEKEAAEQLDAQRNEGKARIYSKTPTLKPESSNSSSNTVLSSINLVENGDNSASVALNNAPTRPKSYSQNSTGSNSSQNAPNSGQTSSAGKGKVLDVCIGTYNKLYLSSPSMSKLAVEPLSPNSNFTITEVSAGSKHKYITDAFGHYLTVSARDLSVETVEMCSEHCIWHIYNGPVQYFQHVATRRYLCLTQFNPASLITCAEKQELGQFRICFAVIQSVLSKKAAPLPGTTQPVWHKRFFSLIGNKTLSYWRHSDDIQGTPAIGEFKLEELSAFVVDSNRPLRFDIELADGRRLGLCAENYKDFEMWKKALNKKAIATHRRRLSLEGGESSHENSVNSANFPIAIKGKPLSIPALINDEDEEIPPPPALGEEENEEIPAPPPSDLSFPPTLSYQQSYSQACTDHAVSENLAATASHSHSHHSSHSNSGKLNLKVTISPVNSPKSHNSPSSEESQANSPRSSRQTSQNSGALQGAESGSPKNNAVMHVCICSEADFILSSADHKKISAGALSAYANWALIPALINQTNLLTHLTSKKTKYLRDINGFYLCSNADNGLYFSTQNSSTDAIWNVNYGAYQTFNNQHGKFLTVQNKAVILADKGNSSQLRICFAIIQGNLKKRSNSGLKRWQSRFFWLSPEGLCYWKQESDVNTHEPVNKYNYSDITAVELDTKDSMRFDIHIQATANENYGLQPARSLSLQAANPFEAELWTSELQAKGIAVRQSVISSPMASPRMGAISSSNSSRGNKSFQFDLSASFVNSAPSSANNSAIN
jgi:hypothetical protein